MVSGSCVSDMPGMRVACVPRCVPRDGGCSPAVPLGATEELRLRLCAGGRRSGPVFSPYRGHTAQRPPVGGVGGTVGVRAGLGAGFPNDTGHLGFCLEVELPSTEPGGEVIHPTKTTALNAYEYDFQGVFLPSTFRPDAARLCTSGNRDAAFHRKARRMSGDTKVRNLGEISREKTRLRDKRADLLANAETLSTTGLSARPPTSTGSAGRRRTGSRST
jgi:hypothetical protein